MEWLFLALMLLYLLVFVFLYKWISNIDRAVTAMRQDIVFLSDGANELRTRISAFGAVLERMKNNDRSV